MKVLGTSEFVGNHPVASRNLRGYLAKHLYDPCHITPSFINHPDGRCPDLSVACARFEETVLNIGQIDIGLLAVGHNGNIAFNEPGSDFAPLTHAVTLQKSTANEYHSYFIDASINAPRAITMGMSTLLSAKKLIVLALGSALVDVAPRMIGGPITPIMPASILQLHPNVICILDEAAAARL